MKHIPPYKTPRAASVLVLLLSAVYLLLSVGILKATHYCQGREASIAYFTAESGKCGCSLFAESDEAPCCNDENDLLKIDVFHKAFTTFEMPVPALPFFCATFTRSVTLYAQRAVISASPSEDDRRPPRALFEFYCSFVFYDAENIS